MRPNVQELRRFYEDRLGQVARHLIARRVRAQWCDVKGLRVAGVGYSTPYLRALIPEAERVIALMPREQGTLHWPKGENCRAALVDELELPLPDMSIDRLIAAHCIEMSGAGAQVLREIWRVLRPEGRVMLVVPNRRGIWARTDHTPFGHGHPYSTGQVNRLLKECMFTPLVHLPCLFIPPIRWKPLLHTATAWERLGRTLWPGLSGVLVVEARKEMMGAVLTAEERARRPQMAPIIPISVPQRTLPLVVGV